MSHQKQGTISAVYRDKAFRITRRAFIMGGLGLLAAPPLLALADELEAQAPTPATEPVTEPEPEPEPGFVAASMKIHFVCSTYSTYINQDIIVIELIDAYGEKRFVLVDGGFGPESGLNHEGYPNRYYSYEFEEARSGGSWAVAAYKNTKAYIDRLGVNASNVIFYMGTHPHPDHMGCAAELIEAYRPPIVLTPEYSDAYLLPSSATFVNPNGQSMTGHNLEDCQFSYDRTMRAAANVGATVVNSLGSWEDASQCICGVKFTVVNWDSDYRARTGNNRVKSPNDFSWGLVVEAFGRKVFLGGDITNNYGTETRLAQWVKNTYGHGTRFDLYKLNHHGYDGSNTSELMDAVNPTLAIATGVNDWPRKELLDQLQNLGARLFTLQDIQNLNMGSLVVTLTDSYVSTNFDGLALGRATRAGNLLYHDGRRVSGRGWHRYNGNFYWIDGGVFPTGWYAPNGTSYYFNATGEIRLGWVRYNGKSGYLDHNATSIWWLKNTIREIDGVTYGFDSSYHMVAGTALKHNGNYYYFNNSGAMVRNACIKSKDGNYYYFGPTGAMVRSTYVKSNNGKYYYFGPTGAMVRSTYVKSNNGKYYYFGADGALRA